MTDNPFAFSEVINTNNFIGRKQEISDIVALLNSKISVSLIGPERIGKSSFLQYLCELHSGGDITFSYDLHLIYLDANKYQFKSQEDMLAIIVKEIDSKLSESFSLQKLTPRLQVRILGKCSSDLVHKLLDDLPFHPVICIDHFDSLLDDNIDQRFFLNLRHWAENGPRLTLVTASVKPLENMQGLSTNASRFNAIFGRVKLGDFASDEVDDLLNLANKTRYPLTAKERKLVRRLAGQNPYYLQIVCWKLWAIKKSGKKWQKTELQKILCDTTKNLPEICWSRWQSIWKYTKEALPWVIILILLFIFRWRDPTFFEPIETVIWESVNTIWGLLNSHGTALGTLLLLIGVLITIVGAIKRGETVGDILRKLKEKYIP